MRKKKKSTIPNPDYIKIQYIRYADDWLIGIWGARKEAILLRETIRTFLNSLLLDLSMEKTLITNARADRAKFLGIYIKRLANNMGPSRNLHTAKGTSRSMPTGNIWMTAPIPEIVNRLEKKGFVKWSQGEWNPQPLRTLLPLPIKDLILRYRVILNGFLNYYSFTDNLPEITKIYWILKESLRKTICWKKKIGPKYFSDSFGKNIELKIRKKDGETVTLDFKQPYLRREPMRFWGTTHFPDPLIVKNWNISTISALGQPCANSGDPRNVEMHHIKHIRTVNPKLNKFDQMAALTRIPQERDCISLLRNTRINRKQIPLSHECHRKVHRGTYQGMSLKHFNYIKWKGTPKWA
jgi:hypothetical protein